MKALLKIIGLLTLVFVCIFLLLNVTGLITIERIEGWLQVANLRYVHTSVLRAILVVTSRSGLGGFPQPSPIFASPSR